MKFCFAVCEYDPLHNGHVYHIKKMKEMGCDAVIVAMSGSFTQRGGVAVLDKYTRAEHAIMAGVDLVVEIPTVFACAPSEVFAKGALKTLSALGRDNVLVFGTESGEKQNFLELASLAQNESKAFKEALKKHLEQGQPYALAYVSALSQAYKNVDTSLLSSPNSILGVEYTKAILQGGYGIEINPIKRLGAGFKELDGVGEFCSSTAIREAISRLNVKKLKKFMPDYVYKSLPNKLPDVSDMVIYSILKASAGEIKDVLDCSEGLENRFKVIARSVKNFDELIDRLETKRYTRARLSRVAMGVMLKNERAFVSKCLKSDLYLKVLAINGEKMELLSEISNLLGGGKTALVTRKSDADKLKGIARECFEKDVFANDVYNLCAGIKTNEYEMKIVNR